MFGNKKNIYMVRVCHAEGFVNLNPTTLAEARELAEGENERWVKLWNKHSSGSRPVVEIWKLTEQISKAIYICEKK